ncbi:hypothetical protein MMC09_006238 [Bachmanniomyces sp. S44760]|nr:hypothetical protein [Bachmanniomyces sp. S44760]
MNLTVTSSGRQFDRLGLMYLGDIEVFRTSTAEPTTNGIIWTYSKDVTHYNTLWKQNQKVIFDLGNLIDSTYTGIYNTTLTATFFTVPGSPATADTILPISSRSSASNQGSAFSIPSQNASVDHTLPRNIDRAVVSLEACGQSAEEFWYTNVYTSDEYTFAATTGVLYGYSPFREVQLLIDDHLAGVSWPFPIIFTGGIVPGFWRPMVGIDAFDLREIEIDITPWLGLLCDGSPHTFQIRVVGLDDDSNGHATLSSTVGSYWLVTGKIFLFLDTPGSVTKGGFPQVNEVPPQISISSKTTLNSTGTNETLTYTTFATRQISISSNITTSSGNPQLATWSQDLAYTNFNALTAQGATQATTQNTHAADSSSSGFQNIYSYPINITSTFAISPAGDISINGSLTHGLNFNTFGPSVIPSGIQSFNSNSLDAIATTPESVNIFSFTHPFTKSTTDTTGKTNQLSLPQQAFSGSILSTTQTASATFFSSATFPNQSYSFGTTEQDFAFSGVPVLSSLSSSSSLSHSSSSASYPSSIELYTRHVKAVNSSVVEDSETLLGRVFTSPSKWVGIGTVAGEQSQGQNHGQSQGQSQVEGASLAWGSVRAVLGRGPGLTKEEIAGGGRKE